MEKMTNQMFRFYDASINHAEANIVRVPKSWLDDSSQLSDVPFHQPRVQDEFKSFLKV